MSASHQQSGPATQDKTWKLMSKREKTIFSVKLGIMFASFGWVFGNTLTPDPVKVAK
ncbi:hypothetical protein [Noviherbaspirillum aerium]|uniref:hypothetical protein n=1 Tax=Noviherbaspirillum aerium TaxID=2588497 RepID=UPI00178C5295|nr:hypothetical protein [Noviherbaspirillum aerium]